MRRQEGLKKKLYMSRAATVMVLAICYFAHYISCMQIAIGENMSYNTVVFYTYLKIGLYIAVFVINVLILLSCFVVFFTLISKMKSDHHYEYEKKSTIMTSQAFFILFVLLGQITELTFTTFIKFN